MCLRGKGCVGGKKSDTKDAPVSKSVPWFLFNTGQLPTKIQQCKAVDKLWGSLARGKPHQTRCSGRGGRDTPAVHVSATFCNIVNIDTCDNPDAETAPVADLGARITRTEGNWPKNKKQKSPNQAAWMVPSEEILSWLDVNLKKKNTKKKHWVGWIWQ